MKSRRTYTPIRIDFTPFVNIALLLIVFFVWVKMMESSNRMSVAFPDETKTFCGEYPVADACLFLLANNRIGYLTYQPEENWAQFIETDYSASGIRKFLSASSINTTEAGTVVMVKPTAQATFGNIVDLIVELRSHPQTRFSISELTQCEKELIQMYQRIKASGLTKPISKKISLSARWYRGG